MGRMKSKPRNAPPFLGDDKMEKIVASLPGAVYHRKHPREGYQKRTDILNTGLGDSLSNNTHTCDKSHEPYQSKDEFVRKFKPFYDRTGAIVPPVSTRARVHDGVIMQGVPSACSIENCLDITSHHNVFYDVRSGEILLVVFVDSEADRFYTMYYEGKSTFPHVGKMRGAEVQERGMHPPLMLTVHDEPVFWGYAEELDAKIANNKVFATLLATAKKDWRMEGKPPTINKETKEYPDWDMPRLRFVQMQESTIKRVVKK